ncbi:UDP-2,4-diacetamido-2,4,6-trideoxy-beta-L-altropyranose hydrolase [Paracoccaceae bacterium]|nr:UDP-2,4-diacetamido-2,4,6-trideoxy-beta-L-altropyranose hydrolase [Paracoccaceae bacterium]
MKLLFRTDVSAKIGTGHLMRCVTIAFEAQRLGWISCFVIRDPEQPTVDLLQSFGIELRILITKHLLQKSEPKRFAHENWLTVSQEIDAQDTLEIMNEFKPDWIIVDHYALDKTWYKIVRKFRSKVFTIDDLGDRELDCDLLLDQNLGASEEKYKHNVPRTCNLLVGPHYALLRDEFKEWRKKSIERRIDIDVRSVLITMGGADVENYTLGVLKELTKSKYAEKCVFKVIIGGNYQYANTLNDFVQSFELKTLISTNVTNMAQIMSESDLCIGAAGSTAWERCCLGLPTITFAIAQNQIDLLNFMTENYITSASNLEKICDDFDFLIGEDQKSRLKQLSRNSSAICDGRGVGRVLRQLEQGSD